MFITCFDDRDVDFGAFMIFIFETDAMDTVPPPRGHDSGGGIVKDVSFITRGSLGDTLMNLWHFSF